MSPLRLPALLAASLIAAAGCARKPSEPANTVPAAPPLTAWPEGRTAPLKITDTLVLAIPLQYERSAIEDARAPRSPFRGVAGRTEARFDFFLPDFSGYTLQNYRNDSDPHKVEVLYLHAGDPHEADPGAPGEYPPNMLKRSLQDQLDPRNYQDMYGLRCYRGRILTDRLACYGVRDAAAHEDILLYVPVAAPAPDSLATLKANYFSRRYSGVRIAWRAQARNLPHWHDIDAQIWKFIDAWNVAPAATAPAEGGAVQQPPMPAGGGQPKLILASRLARESALARASSRPMPPRL
jgi:hypothetical protein